MEYIYTAFFTIIIGIVMKLTNPVMFLLYYPVTKLVFKVIKKDTKKLDDFYLAIPNFFNFTKITDFIFNWIIKPPITALTAIVNFISKAVIFMFNKVPTYVFNLISNAINLFVINPLKWLKNYSTQWTDWIISGKASDYVIEIIMGTINFLIFQIQEMLNTGLKAANNASRGIIPEIELKNVNLPMDAYVLQGRF
jgi:hypothetical protein